MFYILLENRYIMFTEKEYTSETWKDLSLGGETFEKIEFYKCTFQSCNFEKTLFKRCIFDECIFKNCNLSLAKVTSSSFMDTMFQNSKLVGIHWTAASNQIFSVDFLNSVLNYSIFEGMNLKSIKLATCTVLEADFSNATLAGTDCRDTDFAGSTFRNTDLSKADFRGARNYGMNPAENKIIKMKCSMPEVLCLLDEFGVEIE